MQQKIKRFHTVRRTLGVRELLAETRIDPSDLIWPLFIREDIAAPVPVPSMPGVFQYPPDIAINEVETAYRSGLRGVLIFGIPRQKDAHGTSAWNPQGGVQTVIKGIKQRVPNIVIFADCCLCEYTNHGHCGILTTRGLDNDATLDCLKKIAFSYANAGADFIAPSGMMDGAVQAIRQSLDDARHNHTGILAYSAKYASSLYGPFRDAAGSGTQFIGDRKHHQIAPTQRREAILETVQDISEGADLVMVKPGMMYLDIIRELRDQIKTPIVAYQVSGEYSMLQLAIKHNLANDRDIIMESVISLKRAGADLIITYAARDILRILSS
ncbi:porphobilinogen synthase [bacterium]|nr:porphobilinogen synthase [bacterium]